MKTLEKVTDSKLLDIADSSENPIYKENPVVIMNAFKEKFKGYSVNNIMQMRAIMAGDVVIVKAAGNGFFLMFPKDEETLAERNADVAAHNRKVRLQNKITKQENNRRAYDWAKENLGDVATDMLFNR